MDSRVDQAALDRWERPEVDTLITEIDTEYEVFRVVKEASGLYTLYRWFTLVGVWHVSVDVPGASAEDMINELAARVNVSRS